MTPQLAAAHALFAFLIGTNTGQHPDAPSIYFRMLSKTFIVHSRDPMPACTDDAWTLAGLDSLDATDHDVEMDIYSHATMDEGQLQLHFEDGDLSDGCKDFRSTTINLVVAPAGGHSSTLTWIGASSPDCHTEFELELPRAIGEAEHFFDEEEEEQLMLDQLLASRGIGEAEHYFDEEDEEDEENEKDEGDYDFKNINLKLFTWLPVSQGLAQAIRHEVVLITVAWVMPIEYSTPEKAAAKFWFPAPPAPPYQCPLVAAIQALLLPAMVVTGILLLAAVWRRRSTNSKTAPRTDLLPLQVLV
ncbi:hypothetical protein T492DRAFT_1118867 [Pavlovales sp. CCMP2436]|nr:hypothetical protein T492DRAFT_1118867 [Pavlovales sp. CCMP2436]